MYNIGYIAYFELNIDYIVETYCVNKEKPELQCNGKCHLATQLNITLDNTGTTSYSSTIFDAFVPVYFQNYQLDIVYQGATALVVPNWNYHVTFNTIFKDCLDPPPQV